MLPFPLSRQDIRIYVRYLRRSLNDRQQNLAAYCVAKHALNVVLDKQAQYIALYLSVNGELDTRQLIKKLWQQNRQVFLPILDPFSSENLLFMRYKPETILIQNHFGILEPLIDPRYLVPLEHLDIMFVPLVAFDRKGQRLGMGGGFYDRILQNWRKYQFLPIGLAHDCQQVETLPFSDWDVPLPAILTPSHYWQWKS